MIGRIIFILGRRMGLPLYVSALLLFTWSSVCQADQPRRIVSLSPAMTEILYAFGLENRIVGVTNFCDRPSAARSKSKVGGMSNPSLEAIAALHPDMVVLTKDGNPKAIADRLKELGIRTYVFTAVRLIELPAAIREMGLTLGAGKPARQLARSIETSLHRPRSGTASRNRTTMKKKVLFVVWPEPLIVAGPGTIINDAMAINEFTNIAADAKTAYPHYSLEAVVERQPDVIIFGAGPGMNSSSRHLLQRLDAIGALKKTRICYVGDALYRPGPRIPAGIAELKKCGNLP